MTHDPETPALNRTAQRLACLAVLLVAFAALAALRSPIALAHGGMISSDPLPLSTVDSVPDDVQVAFAALLIEDGSSLVVTGPDGSTIETGRTRVEGTTMRVTLHGARPAGEYTVFWTTVSSDGHTERGAFTFTAAGPARSAGFDPMRLAAPLGSLALVAALAAGGWFVWTRVNG